MKDIIQIEPMQAAVSKTLLSRRQACGTFNFPTKPRIIGRYSVVGRKESEGPLGKLFDQVVENGKYDEKTYENAEAHMFMDAVDGALKRAGITEEQVDLFMAGDLLNQIVSSAYTARCYGFPFFGVYNACATSVEALTIAAMMVDAGFADHAVTCTGSHFATAERQYRGPLELGCQRAPYSQWTVTGAGCCVVGRADEGVKLTQATVGRSIDYGITDVTNMGAAMAPAIMMTLINHFEATKTSPKDYDMIVSGDLGKLGEDILRDLMREKDYELPNYIDCGHLLYDVTQNVCQGGSGAGCSATVLNAYWIPKLLSGEYRKILFVATGALMSLTTFQQGESIPSIAHAIVLEA